MGPYPGRRTHKQVCLCWEKRGNSALDILSLKRLCNAQKCVQGSKQYPSVLSIWANLELMRMNEGVKQMLNFFF